MSDLRSYYEAEAALGKRTPLGELRTDLRNRFVEHIVGEGCASVLDLGAGPGLDGPGFRDAGLRYVGVDLAHGNGVLAARAGVDVVQASIDALPVRPGAFDSGWSMSVLMHIPDATLEAVVRELARPFAAGAPMLLTVWGARPGIDGSVRVAEGEIDGERRQFSRRPIEATAEVLGAVADIERTETWDVGLSGEEYQAFWLRIRR